MAQDKECSACGDKDFSCDCECCAGCGELREWEDLGGDGLCVDCAPGRGIILW